MTILLTGAAGFIGSHVAARLLDLGHVVTGVDNLNRYYDVNLKRHRLGPLLDHGSFRFIEANIEDLQLSDIGQPPSRILHLAAQAGVRYSIENPGVYLSSNLVGFGRVLEVARQAGSEHLVYASSSSVYGANEKVPFSVRDEVNHPVSLYAATKRSNELMAQAYSHLYGLPCTGLRFFTVYGPRGRPDMAMFDFTRRILEGEPIHLFGDGHLSRDFTYIDDVVEGVLLTMQRPPTRTRTGGPGVNETTAAHRVFNVGKGHPDSVLDVVTALEEALGRKAIRVPVGRQPGDVDHTWADTQEFVDWSGFQPRTDLRTGTAAFTSWYLNYHATTDWSART